MSQWDVLKLKNQLKNQLKKKFFKASSVLLHLVLFWSRDPSFCLCLDCKNTFIEAVVLYCESVGTSATIWTVIWTCVSILSKSTHRSNDLVFAARNLEEEFVAEFWSFTSIWTDTVEGHGNNCEPTATSVKEERINCKCESNHRLLSLNPNFIRSNTNRFILTLQNRT